MKRVIGSIVLVLAAANFSAAAVNVDVNTPNASIHVGTPQPAPPQQVTVIERDHRHEGRKDNGKHKGQKKHKKERHDEHEHGEHH